MNKDKGGTNMKLKSGGYQPSFPTQSDVPPMPPTKRIHLSVVRIMFKDRCGTRLYDVTKVDTDDKDFIIIHQKDATSFYRKTDIEELHISPQDTEKELKRLAHKAKSV